METLALISMSGFVPLLIHVVIIGLIVWVLWWALSAIGLPEPFAKIVRVVIILIAAVFLINVLMAIDGHAFIGP